MTKPKILTCLAAAAVLTLGTISLSSAQSKPEEFIAARKALMKRNGDATDAFSKAIESGADVTPLAAQAKGIVADVTRFPSLFPVGTENGGNTKAKAEIWADKAGFEKVASNLVTEANKLAALAAAGDKAGFAAQFKTMGAVCGGCHRTYRNR